VVQLEQVVRARPKAIAITQFGHGRTYAQVCLFLNTIRRAPVSGSRTSHTRPQMFSIKSKPKQNLFNPLRAGKRSMAKNKETNQT
jgi:hypothetical protein